MKKRNVLAKSKLLCTMTFTLVLIVSCQNNSNPDVPATEPKIVGNFPLEGYWRKDFDSELEAMAWGSDVLITGILDDGRAIIQAFDITTESSIWKHELPGNSIGINIIVVGKSVYVVFSPKLIAMDLKTGGLLFETDIQASSIDEIAASSDGHVFVVQVSEGVYAVDRFTGKQSWEFLVGRGNVDVFSDTTHELIYIIHGDDLKAINDQDGSLEWQKQIDNQGAVQYYDGFIYYSNSEVPDGSENHLKALSLETKEVIWDFELSEEIKCISATSDSIIVVTTRTLAKLDRISGEKEWEYYISPNVYCPTVIQNSVIFLKIGSSNQIIAMGLDDGSFLGQLDFEDSVGIGYEIPKDNLLSLTYSYPVLAFYIDNSMYIYK